MGKKSKQVELNEEDYEQVLLSGASSENILLGLTQAEAERRLEVYGKNVIVMEKPPTWYGTLFSATIHPFNIVLVFLAIIAIATGDYATFTVMWLMVLLSTLLRFYQEVKANSEAQSLKKMVKNKATVIRREVTKRPDAGGHGGHVELAPLPSGPDESGPVDVNMEDVAIGDIVKLQAGDMIPGDVRLLRAKDVFVSQSALTGEAIPVEKMSTEDLAKHHARNGTQDQEPEIEVHIEDIGSPSNPSTRPNSVYNDSSDALALPIPQSQETPTIKQRIIRIFRKDQPEKNLQKHVSQKKRKHRLEQMDRAFMGTSIVSGTALAIVEATGPRTLFGEMAAQLSKKRPENAFQQGVKRVSFIFVRFMVIMSPIVFILNGIIAKNWLQALLFAIAVAVGLVPEMLPMIVNANLARGAYEMSRKKTIVKRMESIMNFGAMDILCTDKTGTLTQDKVVLLKHMNVGGLESPRVVEFAYLNSSFQTGLRNLLDLAVINYVEKGNQSPLWTKVVPDKRPSSVTLTTNESEIESSQSQHLGFKIEEMYSSIEEAVASFKSKFNKIDEIPFDFVRRRMSVVLERIETNQKMLVCKGAVEEILHICSYAEDVNTFEPIPFKKEEHQAASTLGIKLNREGLRAIAVAYKLLDESVTVGSLKIEDEKDMIFLGFTAFLDPPKESTAPAIEQLMKNGITVKVLTGDNEEVCKTVCEQVRLPLTGVITGKQIEAIVGADKKVDPLATPAASLDDLQNTGNPEPQKNPEELTKEAKFDEIARSNTIFAKLTPLQKAEVVASLRRQGHIVGFLGDGINDAAALREADVGISVDSAVDVAKENADMILLEKSLMVLVKAVRLGRLTYGNTIKYIKMAASSNFGNVFSVLIASAWLPFLPMTPLQILTQNLLYDFSQVAIPWDNCDPDFLAIPRKWSAGDIQWFMFWFGPLSSIFDVCTFATMWFYFGIDSPSKNVSLFQTGWFIEGLWTQTLVVHMIRSDKIPLFQTRPSIYLFSATIVVMGLGLALPFSPLGPFFSMVPPPAMYFPFMFSFLFSYCILTQIVKKIYIYVHKSWM